MHVEVVECWTRVCGFESGQRQLSVFSLSIIYCSAFDVCICVWFVYSHV